MAGFGYDAAVLERFPAIVGGVLHATGLSNGPSRSELRDEYRKEQQEVAARLATTPIAELASIGAWRRTFTGFGVKPTQHRVAAEALLRRLHKKGDIPFISTLVDIANLVSIRHAVPVAVFDQAHVSGRTQVRFSDGNERFTDLGAGQPVAPEPGEVIFVDDDSLVSARRWCWRQSAQSAAGPQTTEALLTVEAVHPEGRATVEAAVADLIDLLTRFQSGAAVGSAVLDATNPTVEFE